MPDGIVNLLGAIVSVTLVRGSLVFVAACTVLALAKKLSGESRHLVWLGVTASFIFIPLAWLLLPAFHVGSLIPRGPAADWGIAAAPALSRAEYAQLIERTSVETSRALRANPLPVGAICAGLVSAWAAGVLLLCGRLAAGTARIHGLIRGTACDRRLQSTALALAPQMSLRSSIRVLLSPHCRIPFTVGVLSPVVVLPAGAGGWPRDGLAAVLTHEIMHVRRRDVLTHSAAYAVCVLLWFFPPAWLAYAALLREAEACCDQKVIDHGIRVPAYAHIILELVRSCRGRMILPGTTTALAGTAMIKERIRNVLALSPTRRPFRPLHAVAVLALFICCLVPLVAVSVTAQASGLPADDPFFGTWGNEEYDTSHRAFTARVVITPDGHELKFQHFADSEPVKECWNTIERAWVEAGAHWYKTRWVCWAYPSKAGKIEGYSLTCISADGSTVENVWAQYGYPEALHTLGPGYGIMYRQK